MAMTLGNAPKQKKEQDLKEVDSPTYSRPPSSTFKGYSFMNFRNDSVSSVGNDKNNLSQIETIKLKQQSANLPSKYDSNPSNPSPFPLPLNK